MEKTWSKTSEPLVFEKELLPTGEICPWVRDDGKPITMRIKEAFVDGLVKQFKKFKEVGVRVPLFNSPLHKEDPDLERGLVTDVVKRQNSSGNPSAFIKVKFHDAEAAQKGTKVDVSAGCPKKFVDGKGNKYEYPLCHVALTSRPVVPALDGWSGPLLLSMSGPNGLMLASAATEGATKEDAPTEADLLGDIMFELGVEAEENADTITMLQQILAAVQELPDANSEEGGGNSEVPKLNLSTSPVMVKELRKSRVAIIEALAKDGVISSSMADTWKKKYVSDDALKADLSLSYAEGDETKDIVTEFDNAVEMAKDLAKDRPTGRQGRTVLNLSHGKDDEDNPLIAGAKKMAEANGVAR